MMHLLVLALLLFIVLQVRGGSLAAQGVEIQNHARRMLAGGEEKFLRDFVAGVRNNHPYEKEFIQAVEEVAQDLRPVLEAHPELSHVLDAMSEPDRIISFRVSWMDDKGRMQVNRGYRVQFNNALGPYKGGLRFHPGVTQSVLKFLAFEQVFKNALTGLSIGGGKGGSDFDPKDKSDGEIMRFCQSFMTELFRHIGAYTDIPAGDIGVGVREIGYLWGQYKRLKNVYEGALTGKACENGGILMRPESTGFGAVYFANEATDGGIAGKVCCVSGSGNVALFCARKLLDKGAKCISLSDSSGTVIEPSGFTYDQLREMQRIKGASRTARVSEYLKTGLASSKATFTLGGRPWSHSCDLAFPCATQNELNEDDADKLISKGCKGVFEGANMPCTPKAVDKFLKNGIVYGPGKAINAGGVAVSALEMAQHAQMAGAWDGKKVDDELQAIMKKIYVDCKESAEKYGQPGNLKFGANVFAFMKVARAFLSQGIV
eukprot:265746_1